MQKKKNLKEHNILKETKNNKLNCLVSGKWMYEGEYENFSDIINRVWKNRKNNKEMPRNLIFGDNSLATDLEEKFSFNDWSFGKYNYTLLQDLGKMVVYEKSELNKNQPIKVNVYIKDARYQYTDSQVNKLFKKYNFLKESATNFNQNLIGHWELIDNIKEKNIKFYVGAFSRKKIVNHPFLISVLDILNDKCVYILKENETYKISKTKTLTRENTSMVVNMTSKNKSKFIFLDPARNVKIWCHYKKIGKNEFIFLDEGIDPSLNPCIYVYKKIQRRTEYNASKR